MRGDEVEERLQPGDDPRLGIGAVVGARLFHDHPHFGHRRVDRGEEEILLAVEIVVERLPRDRGLTHDVGDLRRLVALLGGQLGDGVHHPPTLVTGDELAG